MKLKSLLRTITGVVGLLISCSALAEGTSALESIKKRGTLRVGVEPGFLPFEMLTPKNEWVGFDVELIKAFSQKLGVKPEFVSTKWDGIIPGLMAGKYDLIASGMTITEERAKSVLFSQPYYDAGLKILLNKKLEATVKNLADLDSDKHTILVKLGTTGDIFSTKTFKKAKIRKMDNEADAAQSILLGRGDAFIYDKPFMDVFVSSHPGKAVLLPSLLSTESFGLAAKKNNQDLIESFNVFLGEWKANGGYQAAYKAMFEDLSWKKQFPNQF